VIIPLEAAALFAGMLLISGGWLAHRVGQEMREAMRHDDVLKEICDAAEKLLGMVDGGKYEIASLQYNKIRRLAGKIMKNKPKAPLVRTYSYKPELRAAR